MDSAGRNQDGSYFGRSEPQTATKMQRQLCGLHTAIQPMVLPADGNKTAGRTTPVWLAYNKKATLRVIGSHNAHLNFVAPRGIQDFSSMPRSLPETRLSHRVPVSFQYQLLLRSSVQVARSMAGCAIDLILEVPVVHRCAP